MNQNRTCIKSAFVLRIHIFGECQKIFESGLCNGMFLHLIFLFSPHNPSNQFLFFNFVRNFLYHLFVLTTASCVMRFILIIFFQV